MSNCNGLFLEEVRSRWEFQHTIDAMSFPRLLDLVEKAGQLQTENKKLLAGIKKAIDILRKGG